MKRLPVPWADALNRFHASFDANLLRTLTEDGIQPRGVPFPTSRTLRANSTDKAHRAANINPGTQRRRKLADAQDRYSRRSGAERIGRNKWVQECRPASCLCGLAHHRRNDVPQGAGTERYRTIKQLLLQLRVQIDDFTQGSLRIKAREISDHTAPYELVKTMRASVLVLAP